MVAIVFVKTPRFMKLHWQSTRIIRKGGEEESVLMVVILVALNKLVCCVGRHKYSEAGGKLLLTSWSLPVSRQGAATARSNPLTAMDWAAKE